MSRPIRPRSATSRRRIHGCTIESMPLNADPAILHAVLTVYTTDLSLPEEWTDTQRAEFITAEAEKITWMVRAEAGTIGDRRIEDWSRRTGGEIPDDELRAAMMTLARDQALAQVMSTELYELIATAE